MSYRRLSYTAWHALAEFVDNSTQAALDNDAELGPVLDAEGETLRVEISYDNSAGRMRIADNSIGMNRGDVDRAMVVGLPPDSPTGRSRYGMGLKTAACWLGNRWTVTTTRLGSTLELSVDVNVDDVARGLVDLPERTKRVKKDTHYTVVDISDMNIAFVGRRVQKTKDYLKSMYREDLRTGLLELRWQGDPLEWTEVPGQFLKDPRGSDYRRDFAVQTNGLTVPGWVGVLASGGRSQAGFSIFHNQRMVRGYPDSWRPQEIFGQAEGSNDLVNQRIVGEFDFTEFPVTHTKDDILWSDTEEVEIERAIKSEIADLISVAKRARTTKKAGPGRASVKRVRKAIQADTGGWSAPQTSPTEVDQAKSEIVEMVDRFSITQPDVTASVLHRALKAYFSDEEGPEAVFAAVGPPDASDPDWVLVANLRHPFLANVTSSEALDVYLRLLLVEVGVLSSEQGNPSQIPEWVAMRDSLLRALAPGKE